MSDQERLRRLALAIRQDPGNVGHSPAAPSSQEIGQAAAALDSAAALGIRFVVPGDDEWPANLPVAGAGGPHGLWVRGSGHLGQLTESCVAITGSRASTAYGEHAAADLSRELAIAGTTIVTGGSFGIEAAALRGALVANQPSVVITAGGVDRAYPPAHASLFESVARQGVIVSASPPGSSPSRHRLLERGQLMAEISDATVLVEAATRSGALRVAQLAGDLGKPVFALPGPVTSAGSVGTNNLIKTGQAALATDAGDVLDVLAPRDEPSAPPVVDESFTPRPVTLPRTIPNHFPAQRTSPAR